MLRGINGWAGSGARLSRFGPLRDSTVGLLLGGYEYLPALRRRNADGIATTRIAGRRAVVAAGPDAVRAFYDGDRFTREGTVPAPLALTLFGRSVVHGLDGVAHGHRKELFGSVLSTDRVAALADRVDRKWAEAVLGWRGRERIVVFDEAVQALGRGVLDWAGVASRPDQLARRCRDLAILDERTAASELLNVLWPTVAVAWLVTFDARTGHVPEGGGRPEIRRVWWGKARGTAVTWTRSLCLARRTNCPTDELSDGRTVRRLT